MGTGGNRGSVPRLRWGTSPYARILLLNPGYATATCVHTLACLFKSRWSVGDSIRCHIQLVLKTFCNQGVHSSTHQSTRTSNRLQNHSLTVHPRANFKGLPRIQLGDPHAGDIVVPCPRPRCIGGCHLIGYPRRLFCGHYFKACELLNWPVLFFSCLDQSVGHTMDVLSLFISVLCHSDWLFNGESCLRLDVTDQPTIINRRRGG